MSSEKERTLASSDEGKYDAQKSERMRAFLCSGYDALEAEASQMDDRIKENWEKFLTHVESLLPDLPPGTSKEECREAARVFSGRFYEYKKEVMEERVDLELDRQELVPKPSDFGVQCIKTWCLLSEEDRHSVYKHRESLEEQRKKKVTFYKENMGSRDHEALEYFVHKMMRGQSEEAVKLVLSEHNPFAAHLDRKVSERPLVEFPKKRRFYTRFPQLPVQVTAMIFSHCTLPTCTRLRKVSHQWYHAFNNCEGVLRQKVGEICPWIYPEGDLKTWADCAVLYMHRCNEWRARVDLRRSTKHGFETVGRNVPKAKHLSVLELTELPDGFEHLQKTDELDNGVTVISKTAGETEVEYDGLRITLPGKTKVLNVGICGDKVLVACMDYDWEFPYSKSLHYKNAKRGGPLDMVETFTIGKVFVRKIKTLEGRYMFEFYNPHTKKYLQYGPLLNYLRHGTKPFAVRHGLVWWYPPPDYKYLIATFVDLEEPDFIYTHPNRILEVKPSDKVKGVRTVFDKYQQNGNLVYSNPCPKSIETFQVVDLDARTVTTIQSASQSFGESEYVSNRAYVVGFENGKFRATYWDKPKEEDMTEEEKERSRLLDYGW